MIVKFVNSAVYAIFKRKNFFSAAKMDIPTIPSRCVLNLKIIGQIIGYLQMIAYGGLMILCVANIPLAVLFLCKCAIYYYSFNHLLNTLNNSKFCSARLVRANKLDLWHRKSKLSIYHEAER